MRNLSKNLLLVVFVFFFASVLFSFLVDLETDEIQEVSVNEVARRINDGEVLSIVVSGDLLEVTLNDDSKLSSRKEGETGLVETLRSYGVEAGALRGIELTIKDEGGLKYWLSILIPTLLPLIIIIFIFWWLFRQARGGMNQAFTFGKANLKLTTPEQKKKMAFDDVAGLDEAKEELREMIDFLKHPKKFLAVGARIPRGVLLVGPPGTGKTLLARATAGESNVPFFHISASEFVEMFVGVGASRVRDIFQTAKKAAPSIIFIDEIDAIGRQRGAGLGGGHDEREQTLNQILVEMDGFDRDSNVIIIAATNRPDILDPALLRPGRFDRRIVLDMPDIKSREDILKIHANGKPLAKDVELKQVAVRTPGFSGADLANLMNEAAILTARHGRKEVLQEDILNSIEKVMLGPERRSLVISENEKRITAYHEAGHALVAAGIKNTDPVHKVSIVSRGMAGGYTLKLPTEDRRLKTKSQFFADLAVALGGFVSESIVFKDVTTGSSNDIQMATEVAHNLVTRYGMSEKLGPRTFGKTDDLIFLGREISSEKNYSEKVAAQIDAEVNKLIMKAMKAAKSIISRNRKLLDKLAATLMEKEILEQDEFYKIVKRYKLKPVLLAS